MFMVYARFRRWSRSGVLVRLFAALREQEAVGKDADCFGLDSTSIKVHPDDTGHERRTVRKASESRAAAGTRRPTWSRQQGVMESLRCPLDIRLICGCMIEMMMDVFVSDL